MIAYGAGGALETVIDGVTGRFFHEPTAAALVAAVTASQSDYYDPALIRRHAESYGCEIFLARMRDLIRETIEAHQERRIERVR